MNDLSRSNISLSHRPKAEGPREKLTNTSVAASEAQDKESTETISKKSESI
jgi:hypothetical protein